MTTIKAEIRHIMSDPAPAIGCGPPLSLAWIATR